MNISDVLIKKGNDDANDDDDGDGDGDGDDDDGAGVLGTEGNGDDEDDDSFEEEMIEVTEVCGCVTGISLSFPPVQVTLS